MTALPRQRGWARGATASIPPNRRAPFAGQILAALGADVWKVERPTGDSARGWGPSKWKDSGAAFHAINRGKRFISLEIKDRGEPHPDAQVGGDPYRPEYREAPVAQRPPKW